MFLLPWRATPNTLCRSDIIRSSSMTCLCWELVLVRYRSFLPLAWQCSTHADRAHTVFPVPVPLSITVWARESHACPTACMRVSWPGLGA